MKTRLIFLLLFIACYSCGTNKSVSDAQKEKIKGEVKEVVNTFFKGCEEVNFDMVLGTFFDSPDFVYINNGYAVGYKECADILRPVFSSMINQKITIVDEKYAFPDNSTVLYTNGCKGLTNYKDGHAIIQDPTVMLLIFKKINAQWKIIYGVESYIQQNARNTETSKELNQVELMKQFSGTWKCDISKDTTIFYEGKSYGTGLECYFKVTSQGKTVSEGKQLRGYDKKLDKFIFSGMMKGTDMVVFARWFISKNKYLFIPYNDLSNPDGASLKWEGEFKSPEMIVETRIVNNQPLSTSTWTRVK